MKIKDIKIGEEKWVNVGSLGVDTGRLMIGDPCYFVDNEWTTKELEKYNNINKKFIKILFPKGHEGKGIIFSVGFGDGTYKLKALLHNYEKWGVRVKEVKISFEE